MITRIVHDVCYGASLVLNGVLIFLILTRTPAYLRRYSIVLLYLSIVELSTAISSLLVFKKYMSTSSYFINAAGGVCRYWSSPSFCFDLNAVQLAGTSHYAVMIAFCSCYRYYIVACSRREPKISRLLLALVCIHLPTIVIYANFTTVHLLEGAELEKVMNESHPEYDINAHREEELLIVNRLDFSSQLASLWIQVLIFPCVFVIVVASVRIHSILASIRHMSDKSKRRHAHILKSILPALYAVGVIVYRAERENISQNNSELGHLATMIASIFTVLGPLLTLIFTLPYRNALLRMFWSGNDAGESSVASQKTTTGPHRITSPTDCDYIGASTQLS